MSDQCRMCTYRGDPVACDAYPDDQCSIKESWAYRRLKNRALLWDEMVGFIRCNIHHSPTKGNKDLLAHIEAMEKGE